MAEINQDMRTEFHGPFGSSVYAFIVVTFNHDEATAAAAIAGAIALAALSAPPPANVVVAAVLADRAKEIISKNGPDGVFVEIHSPVLPPGTASIVRIGERHVQH